MANDAARKMLSHIAGMQLDSYMKNILRHGEVGLIDGFTWRSRPLADSTIAMLKEHGYDNPGSPAEFVRTMQAAGELLNDPFPAKLDERKAWLEKNLKTVVFLRESGQLGGWDKFGVWDETIKFRRPVEFKI